MAFKCQGCEKVQPNHTKCFLTPVGTRPREYTYTDKKTKRQKKSRGWEIVVEAKLCFDCHQKYLASERR
jgi:hypothetical protein